MNCIKLCCSDRFSHDSLLTIPNTHPPPTPLLPLPPPSPPPSPAPPPPPPHPHPILVIENRSAYLGGCPTTCRVRHAARGHPLRLRLPHAGRHYHPPRSPPPSTASPPPSTPCPLTSPWAPSLRPPAWSRRPSPLYGSLAFGKYVRSVVRSQQSRITSVLKSVRISGFSARNGHRVSARKVLVMLLDPSSTSKLTQVAHEAAKIRGDDVEVFVVTSGRQGGQLVHDIVSEPGHVIQLPAFDFSNYAFASDIIVGSICGGVCLLL